MRKLPLVLSVFVIILAAVANLARFLWNIPIIIGTTFIPPWTGALAFIILGLLAAWSLRGLWVCDHHCEPKDQPKL